MIKLKLQSRRFWAAAWAMFLTTFIVGAAVFAAYDASWIGITLPILIGIVGLWIGAESMTKIRGKPNLPADGEGK